MPLVCKDASCRSDDVKGPHGHRFVCLQCNRIFVTNDLQTESSADPSQPECFGNYDPNCSICSADCDFQESCSKNSPPLVADLPPVSPSPEHGAPTECPNCGHVDRGTFCSKCGSVLEAEHAANLFVQVVREIFIKNWLKYFCTVKDICVFPGDFFSGAFSRNPTRFHYERGTLRPAKFFAYHVAFMSIVRIGLTFLLPSVPSVFLQTEDIEGFPRILSEPLDVFVQFVSIYVISYPLMVLLRIESWRQRSVRRVVLTCSPQISLENVLKATTYAWVVDIFGTPALALVGAGLTSDWTGYPVLGWGLVILARIVGQFIVLPRALPHACRISKDEASMAIGALYGFFLLLYMVSKELFS